MLTPVRTTLLMGILNGVFVMCGQALLPYLWGWTAIMKLCILINLVTFFLLLCHWSGTSCRETLYPLIIATGAAIWPTGPGGFILLALGLLSWVRSGICFTGAPLRSFFAEAVTAGGGAVALLLYPPGSALGIGLACWLFFLVQSLYFFIAAQREAAGATHRSRDAFEAAFRQTQRILARQEERQHQV